MRIAVLQSETAGWTPEARLERLSGAAEEAGADLLLCPELFLSGYDAGDDIVRLAEPADGPFARSVAKIARRTGTAIVYGYPERSADGIYNSALAIGADGMRLANHRKLGLPPGFESRYMTAGAGLTMFDTGGLRFALLICYDVEFPETVRAAAQAGANAVLVPTALSNHWPVVAQRLVPTRAFENGVYVAYANHAGEEGAITYLGASCICDPVGRDLARAGARDEVISAEISRDAVQAAQARLPYLRDVTSLAGKLA